LYQFGLADPFSQTDPLGLYAEGGHYYTTFYVALLLGYSAEDAQVLAFFSQLPDEVSDFDAIEGAKATGMSMLASGLCNAIGVPSVPNFAGLLVQQEVHALTGGSAKDVTASAAAAVAATPSPLEAGLQIHRLGDSFAHRVRGNETQLYETGLGHARHGTSPDVIQSRPALYRDYVLALAVALGERRGQEAIAPAYVLDEITSLLSETNVSEWSLLGNHALADRRFNAAIRSRIEEIVGHKLRYRPERFLLDHSTSNRTSVESALKSFFLEEGGRPPGFECLSDATVWEAFNRVMGAR
jgi:hypothetical protein